MTRTPLHNIFSLVPRRQHSPITKVLGGRGVGFWEGREPLLQKGSLSPPPINNPITD